MKFLTFTRITVYKSLLPMTLLLSIFAFFSVDSISTLNYAFYDTHIVFLAKNIFFCY
jgi:hypothetical protein